ncbi:MAG: AmmeMemoRadiSam system radical SAM enzyme [Candidatus Altiarchaeota archaeon]
MKEASFYKTKDDKAVCFLCPHGCVIGDGKRGICGVRENHAGKLYSLVYGKAAAAHVDPIEKKPLFHYKPGTNSYSISTVGCNLSCSFCQNWDISQSPKTSGQIMGKNMSPEEIVGEALKTGCESISYTYTEPTVFFEYAKDTGVLARTKGLGNVFVSNGFMGEEAFKDALSFLDAANIDLKSIRDEFYRKMCGARLEPVLDTLRRMVSAGIWVEVTTLLVTGENDSDEELEGIASFIRDELGAGVPWHVSRFHPDYKLTDAAATPLDVVRRAWSIGKDAGLKYVYAGNIPHEEAENTFCPKCGATVIARYGFSVAENMIVDGGCRKCGEKIGGAW